MPIEIVVQKLYKWMKSYSESHKIDIVNIHLWAKHNGYSYQEVGYALQVLKSTGHIEWKGSKYGWKVN